MRISPFRAVYPNLDFLASPEQFFETVKQDYANHKKNGFFLKTEVPAIYLYQIVLASRSYTGLIVCSDVQDYLDGRIKKHELTLASREQQQVQLLLSRKAMVKPVLLTYPQVGEIKQILLSHRQSKAPFYTLNFVEEQAEHRFWQIKNPADIQQLQELFSNKVPLCYIADGHHRCSSTALLYERKKGQQDGDRFRNVLSVFFPSEELEIHEFNRVVEGLNGHTPASFMAKLSKLFEIEVVDAMQKPRAKHELTMLLEGVWYRLSWRKYILQSYSTVSPLLDASLLNEMILRRILGIIDVRNNPRVKYVGGPEGWDALLEKAFKNEHRVVFLLHPIRMKELMSMANAGKMLPPKSTWFEPRIKNGLLVYEY